MFSHKKKLLLAVFCIFVQGCTLPFYEHEKYIDFSFIQFPESVTESDVSAYRQKPETPKLSCKDFNKRLKKAQTLSLKGMNDQDIYWEITNENSNYVEQVYLAMYADAIANQGGNKHPIEDTCGEIPTLQKGLDQFSILLFNHIDFVYQTYYHFEAERYNDFLLAESDRKTKKLTGFISSTIGGRASQSLDNITDFYKDGEYNRGQAKKEIMDLFVYERDSVMTDTMYNLLTEATVDVIQDYIYSRPHNNENDPNAFYMPTTKEVRDALAKEVVMNFGK